MTETAEAQRTRILAAGDTNATDYDLAVDLGYQPETWDGMWKLAAHDTFSYRHGCVIAREAIDSEHTRLVTHRLPDGWSLVNDQRLLEIEPRIVFVSPRSRARAEAITRR